MTAEQQISELVCVDPEVLQEMQRLADQNLPELVGIARQRLGQLHADQAARITARFGEMRTSRDVINVMAMLNATGGMVMALLLKEPVAAATSVGVGAGVVAASFVRTHRQSAPLVQEQTYIDQIMTSGRIQP